MKRAFSGELEVLSSEDMDLFLCYNLEKTLMLRKTEGKRRRGQQRMRWFNSITDSTDGNLGEFQEMARAREDWCTVVHGVAESGAGLGDRTTTTKFGA